MLHGGSGEGGLRHRDAGGRHQHAGALGRDREAEQVHRRAPRLPDAGEYTQLTGRAGRRGIDTVGDAVVLWSPFVPFDQVAALATSPLVRAALGLPTDLQHGRQPGAVVLGRAGPPPAEPVVRPVPGRPRRGAGGGPSGAPRGRAGRAARRVGEPYGDIDEYRRLVAARRPTGPPAGNGESGRIEAALARLRPGDVAHARQGSPRRAGGGADGGPAQELGPQGAGAHDTAGVSCRCRRRTSTPPPGRWATSTSRHPSPRTGRASCARWPGRWSGPSCRPETARRNAGPAPRDDRLAAHPVAADPDLPDLLRAANQADRVEREVDDLRSKVKGRSESLGRRFDRVLRILEAWG